MYKKTSDPQKKKKNEFLWDSSNIIYREMHFDKINTFLSSLTSVYFLFIFLNNGIMRFDSGLSSLFFFIIARIYRQV